MPTIAVGFCNMRNVMAALQEEAERVGVISRACRITPGLLGVQETDLRRLASRPRTGVYYDGRNPWIGGVDYTVHR